jgi:hypothetical protein
VTTKVVVNQCFGGFGLSFAAQRAYLERKGKTAFFYLEDRASASRPSDRDYVRIEEPKDEPFGAHTCSVDLGERVSSERFWGEGEPFSDRDIERDDPDLVAVVEEFGDLASGWAGKLAVVEIPDGVRWEVEEYDGLERVAEVHRTWG